MRDIDDYIIAINEAFRNTKHKPRIGDEPLRYVSGDMLRVLTDNLYYMEDKFCMDIYNVSIIKGKVDMVCFFSTPIGTVDCIIQMD